MMDRSGPGGALRGGVRGPSKWLAPGRGGAVWRGEGLGHDFLTHFFLAFASFLVASPRTSPG